MRRAQLGLTAITEAVLREPSLPLSSYRLPGSEPHRAITPRSMTEEQRSRGEQGTFLVARSHSTWVTAGFSSSFCTNSQSCREKKKGSGQKITIPLMLGPPPLKRISRT